MIITDTDTGKETVMDMRTTNAVITADSKEEKQAETSNSGGFCLLFYEKNNFHQRGSFQPR